MVPKYLGQGDTHDHMDRFKWIVWAYEPISRITHVAIAYTQTSRQGNGFIPSSIHRLYRVQYDFAFVVTCSTNNVEYQCWLGRSFFGVNGLVTN